jgi:isoquinoline 1-oxidoreductase beta subunit
MMSPAPLAPTSRRSFLKASAAAGGGLLLGLALPGDPAPAGAADVAPPGAVAFAPDAFIRIDRQGRVTLIMHKVEMGQGIHTGMAMLIAEELEVELDRVAVEAAPPDEAAYADPTTGMQMTGGSTSVRGAWEPLRRAGATARSMLVAAAAQSWNVDVAACRAEKGEVIHAASGRRLGYGALADTAATLSVPDDVPLKAAKDFTLIGTPAARIEGRDKVTGQARFGIDVRLPGMKFATVAACPVFGGKLASVDDGKAKAVRGVRQIVRLADAVAVVADHMGAALKGLHALVVTWDDGPNARLGTSDIVTQLAAASEKSGTTARDEGDATGAMAGAASRVEAIYQLPFLAHAAMEPINCTVHVRPDGCDLWLGTQIPGRVRAAAAKVTGLATDRIAVHNQLIGGAFGRRLEVDYVVQAVEIAKQVDGPVKIVWTREEDTRHDLYRPAYHHRIAAGLDGRGMPVAWTHRVTGSSILARFAPPELSMTTIRMARALVRTRGWGPLLRNAVLGLDLDAVEGAAEPPYALPNLHVD